MMSMIKRIETLLKTISSYQRKAFSWVFLQAIYLFGLGLTSIVGRIAGAKFLGHTAEKSSWQSHVRTITTKTMY